jgi:hypothetical protein
MQSNMDAVLTEASSELLVLPGFKEARRDPFIGDGPSMDEDPEEPDLTNVAPDRPRAVIRVLEMLSPIGEFPEEALLGGGEGRGGRLERRTSIMPRDEAFLFGGSCESTETPTAWSPSRADLTGSF